MESKEFFTLEKTQTLIKEGIDSIETLKDTDDFSRERNKHINSILGNIYQHPFAWDKNCQVNIHWMGEYLLSSLKHIENNKSSLDMILSICYRFLIELFLTLDIELRRSILDAKTFIETNIDQFDENAQKGIKFASTSMPMHILKELNHFTPVQEYRNFEQKLEQINKKIENWEKELQTKIKNSEKELNKKEKEAKALKDNLDKYKDAFNFVGLYKGFNELFETKNKEKNFILKSLIAIAILILVPLISELLIIISYRDNILQYKDIVFISLIPTISIIGILIYYFRILLHNYKSIKSQILQIELRKTLCQFIQNYSKYSQEIKKQDNNALEKFENIIFSGIISDDEKLPSTFDGLEQVSKFIKSLK